MCNQLSPVILRSPSQWHFIAICEMCGLVVSSMLDGGAALSKLEEQHKYSNVNPFDKFAED